jgi:hypothetical protein
MPEFTLTGTSTVELPPCSTDGVSRPITGIGAELTSLEGDQTTQIMARKITFTLNFGMLDDEDYDLLLQFRDGRQGNGPFTLHDPRDDEDTTYSVNLPLEGGLTDDSPKYGIRGPVQMLLVEV